MAANDINRPSPVLLMSLIIPALLACTVAYYLATMPLEPAGSTVPTLPALVVDVQTAPVLDDRVTGVPAMSPVLPATPVLISSTIYTGVPVYILYIPIVVNG